MKNQNSSNSFSNKASIVTIGTFDGVHVGHQEILKRLISIAEIEGLESVVLTFFPHPRMVLQKDSNIKLLNTIDERYDILSDIGIDNIVIQNFTQEYSRLTAIEFIRDILVNKLKAKIVVVGYDHHFGRNRSANIEDLKEYGEVYNFRVIEIPAKDIANVAVSSTKIRNALAKGDVTKANKYLGYNFMLTGTVVKGNGLGKTINFPTANISIEETYKLIPKNGVYIINSILEDKLVYGMMNIGKKPTVKGKKKTIEVHFFDYEKDIYGQKLQINLLKRIRNEEKFDSIELLQEQLHKDKRLALAYIETIKNE